MNRKTSKLTDTDWTLLKELWEKQPQTMGAIVQSVRMANPDNKWSYKTFFTYLNNLCTKGYAAYEIHNAKADRLYFSLISREEAMEMESETLLTRISGDGLSKLIATMAKSDQLTEKDRRKLMKLVTALEREETKRGE